MLRLLCCSVAALCVFSTNDLWAQTAESTDTGAPPADAAPDTAPEATADGLLTAAELQTLVAPVALYPDTLLIQVLVAATAPLDIIKADRLVKSNEGTDPAELKPLIEAEEFDASVAVLAEAFPEVLGSMAEHVEWTETVGTAMLAQDQDVMDAVQVMRQQAINSGALIDTPEQEVTVEETLSTQGTAAETVVIQPADPEVVYVPQYDSQTVYDSNSNSVGDVVATTAIAFGTAALINEIFDDDDDWNDYWGCGNCGGWNGGPIINDPHVDIDIDNDIDIGNGNRPNKPGDGNRPNKPGDGDRPNKPGDGDRPNKPGDGDRPNKPGDGDRPNKPGDGDRPNKPGDGDRPNKPGDGDKPGKPGNGGKPGDGAKPETRPAEGGWQPKPEEREKAQKKIAAKKGEDGATKMPVERPASKSDELRKNLSKETGAEDISGSGLAAGAALGAGAAAGASKLSKGSKKDALKKGDSSGKPVSRPATSKKPTAKKPAAKKPTAAKPKAKAPTAKAKPKISKKSGGNKAKAASKRGKSSKKKSGKKRKR